MQDNPTNDQENQEPSRRRFLKAAAGAGVVGAVWAEPVIRGIPAYAADASSIVGSVMDLQITWSTMRSNWEDDTDGDITQTSVSGPDQSGNVCGINSTWETTVAGETVTVTAAGGPGGDSGACANPVTATISLESQTGCTFVNVSVDAGSVNMTSGNPIVWSGAEGQGMVNFDFGISCG